MGGLLWSIFLPSNCLLLLCGFGLLLLFLKRRKLGLWLATIGWVGFVLWGISPIGHMMITALETRFPQPELPEKISGIIVLGGSLNLFTSAYWEQPALNDRAERLTAAIGLGRRYPDAPLIVTGGGPRFEDGRLTEAGVANLFFEEQGVENPVVLENKASTTFENAQNLSAALPHDTEAPWILVTSSYHMPRSVGLFRKAGLEVVPYPVDYKTVPEYSGWWYQIASAADDADFAAREWMGLFVYHQRGWIDDVFPGPEQPD